MHVQKDSQWSSELGRAVGDEPGGTVGAQLGELRRLGDIGCHGERVFAHSAMIWFMLEKIPLLHREWREVGLEVGEQLPCTRSGAPDELWTGQWLPLVAVCGGWSG